MSAIEGLNRAFFPPAMREVYNLLPFKFQPFDADRYIAVNAGGDYILTSRNEIVELIEKKLIPSDPILDDLEARQFIYSSSSDVAVELLATHKRTRMSKLSELTGLHIFVVTLRCDHTCQYCQVSRVSEDKVAFDMPWDIAERALQHVFESPSRAIKIEFQGGEPLLNFGLIQRIVERAEQLNDGRDLQFVIATNLAYIDSAILEFCRARPIFFSTSLDGPREIHNEHRPRPGRDSYEQTIAGINRVRAELGNNHISALMTSTADSLLHPEEIIDEYVAQGFDSIFLRPISPYGFAAKAQRRLGYEADMFLDFYKRALAYIIGLNKQGIKLVETYSALLLTRILTSYPTGYVDLQSPAGIGIGAIVYNYDGRVYSADEGRMLAEMGDYTFCMGHVNDSYQKLFLESTLLPMLYESMVEAVPMCADCAFQLYCGSDPVYHHRTQGDHIGHRPTSGFCRRNMEVIRHLIHLLEDDPEAAQVLRSWV